MDKANKAKGEYLMLREVRQYAACFGASFRQNYYVITMTNVRGQPRSGSSLQLFSYDALK